MPRTHHIRSHTRQRDSRAIKRAKIEGRKGEKELKRKKKRRRRKGLGRRRELKQHFPLANITFLTEILKWVTLSLNNINLKLN